MNINNVLNITGILLALFGAVLLFFIDLPSRKLAVAEGSIPNDRHLDVYNAAKTGVEYIPSPQEQRCRDLRNAISPSSGLLLFRVALGLIVLGVLCQIVAASTDLIC